MSDPARAMLNYSAAETKNEGDAARALASIGARNGIAPLPRSTEGRYITAVEESLINAEREARTRCFGSGKERM